VEHARSGARGDERAGDVARTHDAVVGRARHAQPVERQARHPLARPRRVGDEHHRAAALAEARERIAGIGRGGDAVVDDAPDVAEHDVVVAGERGEVRGERGEHNRHGISERGGRDRVTRIVARAMSTATSAPNPKFAHVVLQERLRTSGSKGALEA